MEQLNSSVGPCLAVELSGTSTCFFYGCKKIRLSLIEQNAVSVYGQLHQYRRLNGTQRQCANILSGSVCLLTNQSLFPFGCVSCRYSHLSYHLPDSLEASPRKATVCNSCEGGPSVRVDTQCWCQSIVSKKDPSAGVSFWMHCKYHYYRSLPHPARL